ncbi:helix-turn-helix domain-containing protein [Tautonia plasticadhaerens]|uniref:Helix-turn-helix protein n=1 Tax=Tautonia plasticadhaerens TaxID=2527974 RepID=A0A518GZM8_9BACT|nr:helix-turn-helix transcriptional regulator [Tautonia plasticadhaerens]QDV34044.1 helix-turn-helix protein [Tautonia plasticadhaerens]
MAKKKPPTKLGEQLRAAIEARGLSGGAVARMAGVDPRSIGRWLAGTQGLNLDTAEKVAEALGLRLR